jgi:hypothetical protein
MVKLGGFVPEVGQDVLIVNHLGVFRITSVDSKARSANVTILRSGGWASSGGSLEGIPWDDMTPWDEETRDLLDKASASARVCAMTCRQFEDAMRVEFADADANYWRDQIVKESLDRLPSSLYRDHLRRCNDCQTSLWQFFEIRHRVDYTREPCFHVAYYSADVRRRCLEKIHGMYSIATMDKREHGIIIARCPWCGVSLPTGANEKPFTPRIN